MFYSTKQPPKHMGGTPAGPLSGLSDDPVYRGRTKHTALQKCSGRYAICPDGAIENVGDYPGQYFAVGSDQGAAGAFMGLSLLAWAIIGVGGYYGYKWFTKRESKAKRNNRLARYKSNPAKSWRIKKSAARKAAKKFRRLRSSRYRLSTIKKVRNKIMRSGRKRKWRFKR